MSLSVELKNTGLDAAETAAEREKAQEALGKLWSGDLDFTGWVKAPSKYSGSGADDIKKTAAEIREKCDVFLVLGVGGSFMGAKAVIDMLAPDGAGTKVLFEGYNFSARYINELKREMEGKDVCICVISKSGTTTETLSAYGIFRQMMVEKYGPEETASRTYIITERRSNYLFDEAQAKGETVLDLPLDIGGRYSVITPVGLLPIAVAGIDIDRLTAGAMKLQDREKFAGAGLDYAISRQQFYRKGLRNEVFEFFDPYFAYFGEWLKQLFGETEGKDGKGIFPASLMFSRDLHSMGQFLQQGTPCFFETFVEVKNIKEDVRIPDDAMKPFAGKTIQQINECAEKGVLAAHVKAGIPVVSITIDDLDEENVGEMIYFFETECAVSAMLAGVNPFDQPGVEAYKKEMRAYITELGE
ncbi:MAG: glucose-6-phosphate isomerase [Anaerovoracaceae bacterium]